MVKSQVEYKERITRALEELSPSHLSSVLDFIEYLRDKQAWRETREILGNKELMSQLKEADREWRGGSYKEGEYIEWKRKDV